ncbi:DUF1826 domain-containing protein [Polymorphobacter multimanifer]|uniref:DUF1826 domain-containing protein n=1 Tax=Polymorphobacter multimanifer TaxID=1070431 RepID=UPI00166E116B|nr:DUF1826 domain-containing protein [Polymorphobacter multimanifer]
MDVLADIHDPAINLAVWQRMLDDALAADAARLLRFQCEPLRLELAVADVAAALPGAMVAAGWPPAPRIAMDMALLAGCLADVMACAAVSLRLEVITGDACRKYHADQVTARLITSYAGPGSQWLCDGDAAALAAGVSPDQVVPEQLQPGEVALFKGRRWSATPIIHRSPPIAGTGQRRLVLVINPAEPECLS